MQLVHIHNFLETGWAQVCTCVPVGFVNVPAIVISKP